MIASVLPDPLPDYIGAPEGGALVPQGLHFQVPSCARAPDLRRVKGAARQSALGAHARLYVDRDTGEGSLEDSGA